MNVSMIVLNNEFKESIRQFEFVAKNQFLFIFRQSIGLVLELNFSWKLTYTFVLFGLITINEF